MEKSLCLIVGFGLVLSCGGFSCQIEGADQDNPDSGTSTFVDATTQDDTDVGNDPTPDQDNLTDGGGEPQEDAGQQADTDSGVDLGECLIMADCQSDYCDIRRNIPADSQALCTDPPDAGTTNFLGNVRDFETETYLASVEIRIGEATKAAAAPAAVYNDPIITFTSDSQGFFERRAVKVPSNVLSTGLVTLVKHTDYEDSLCGLVQPKNAKYPFGLLNHDVLIVSTSYKTKISALMEQDDSLRAYAPLGSKKAALGKIQYVETGKGVEGVRLAGTNTSSAKVFYLNQAEDGFSQDVTSSNGIFLVVNPGLLEKFEVERAGQKINVYTAVLGAVSGWIAVVTIPVYLSENPNGPYTP